MKPEQLQEILTKHKLWLKNKPEGTRADLSRANLSWADLSGADLSRANLSRANLSWADLSGADLSGADLRGANLGWASLSWASLSWADLSGANLRGANLSGADLRGANLSGVNLNGADLGGANLSWANLSGAVNIPNLGWTIIVPEGDLIVYKKVSNGVAKLKIPAEAKRSNATTRKCRASKAIVLECPIGAVSKYDRDFKYVVGETIQPANGWDENRWNECAPGIHFFLTREEAESY